MSSSLVKMNAHVIFHTKMTSVALRIGDLPRVFEYIGGIVRGIGGIPIVVGGMPDHIHILASIPATISIADFVKTVKAKSSKWIKSLNAYYGLFAWQEGYGAFSVSPSMLEKTSNYIINQAEHHRRLSFEEEYKEFLKAYEVKYDERYLFTD